jgi:tripartite-type tricarboxylate transporter receptor subunit TctC
MPQAHRRSVLKQMLVGACCWLDVLAVPAFARSDYPNRLIKIVVPLPAGTIADFVPRLLAERLAAKWSQPVIIENRPGAGHLIGAEAVANSAPDGYTLFATPPGPLVTSQLMYKKLAFDPTAFVPITILSSGDLVLVVNPKVPAATLRELVAYAKANPGKLTYASPGIGTSPHLTGVMLDALAGIETTHVPYKGLGLAMNDLLAGRVDMMFDNLSNSLAFIKSGKVRALGLASDRRAPQLPGVPTVAEFYPGFLSPSWYALVAPPHTPADVVDKLSRATAEILREPAVVERLHALSVRPIGNSPEEAAAFIREQAIQWRQAVGPALAKLR